MDELRALEFGNFHGFRLSRFQKFIDFPETLSEELAKFIVSEIPKISDNSVKAAAISACAQSKFYSFVFPFLLSLAKQNSANTDSVTGAVMNGLLRVSQINDATPIGELLMNNNVGPDRGLLVSLYAKLAKKSAIPTLLKCLNDPDTKIESLKALSMLGETSIQNELLDLSSSNNSYFRKVAREALERLKKKANKEHKQHRAK